MGWIASTSARSILAVDASPSGPKNGCLAVPGLTPFAGRLRPVGAVGFGIVEVASAPLGRRCVPFRAEKRLPRLYQGSRPSLADYAPLGLSDSEFQRTSHASTAMSLAPFNRIAAMPQSLASLYMHLVFSTKDRHRFLACRSIRLQPAGSDASSPNGA